MTAIAPTGAPPRSEPSFHDLRPRIPDIAELSFGDKMRVFRRVLSWVKPYRFFLVLMLVLTFVETLLGMVDPFLNQIIIDDVLVQGEKSLLHVIFAFMIGLFLVRTIYGFIAHYVSFYMLTRINFDMRRRFFQHLERLSIRFYEQNPLAEVAQTENNNLPQVQEFVVTSLNDLAGHILGLLVGLVILFTIHVKLAFFSVLSLPIWILATNFFTKRLGPMAQQMNEQQIVLKNRFFQFDQGIALVKSANRGAFERKRYFGEISNLGFMHIRMLVWQHLFHIVVGSVSVLSGAFVLWYGGMQVLEGALSIGQLVAFTMFLNKLLGPVSALLNFYQSMNPVCVAALRVFAVWDLPYEIQDRTDAIGLKKIKGYVEFSDVGFAYDPGEVVLKGVSFEALPGEMVAFCGPSGSGKSTIAKLALRFYDPASGAIFVDGFDLRDLRYSDYLDQVGIVFQKPFLFQDSIANNILYGKPSASPDEVVRAARLARAHDFIMKLPRQYDTMIGALESGLSGGQVQRIAIARTILKDPRILILDEATSALDTETEMQIKAALDYLMRGRTSLVIAHRLSTIVDADKIVVMEGGEIREVGNHHELMATRGLYYSLYQKSSGEAEDEG